MTHADAALHAGDRLLAALDADDFDAVLEATRERGACVDRLVQSGEAPDAEAAARFVHQDRALADRIRRTQERLADALRQAGRVQHAAGQYAASGPMPTRLHAHG